MAERSVVSSLRTQALDRVEQTINELVREFARDGQNGLQEAIEPRLRLAESRLHYAVKTADGMTLIGDEAMGRFMATVPAGQTMLVSPGIRAGREAVVAIRMLEGGQTLVVVDDLASVDEVVDVLRSAFANLLVATALLGLLAGLISSRYLLRQLDTINRAATAIIGGDLGRRIPTSGANDEFDRLRQTLNQMLDKIGDLLSNIQQVSTDIAHDLRTPLSRLRHRLEHAQVNELDPASFKAVIEAATIEIDGILATFSALLRIAQIESGARRSAFRSVDLSEVMQLVVDAFGAVAEDSGRHFQAAIEPGLHVDGDRELLVQLFSNLVENAVIHTPPGSSISVELTGTPTELKAVVADNGRGIGEQDRPFVARRFYRSERSRSTPGSGLGLSLATAIANLHDTEISLLDNGPGLRAETIFQRAA